MRVFHVLMLMTVMNTFCQSILLASSVAFDEQHIQKSSSIHTSVLTEQLSEFEVSSKDVHMYGDLKEERVKLIHGQDGFKVALNNAEIVPILSHNIRGLDSRIPDEQLFSGNFYFTLKSCGKNYTLDINCRLRGGGDRWNGFKGWLVGPHPGWDVFKKDVLPNVGEGIVIVGKTVGEAVIEVIKNFKK